MSFNITFEPNPDRGSLRFSRLMTQAGFVSRIVAQHSIWVESFILYELTVG
jgi:hypothetical protein